MSPCWRPEFWDGSWVFGNFMHPWLKIWRTLNCVSDCTENKITYRLYCLKQSAARLNYTNNPFGPLTNLTLACRVSVVDVWRWTMEQWRNDNWPGQTHVLKWTCPSAIVSITNYSQAALGSKALTNCPHDLDFKSDERYYYKIAYKYFPKFPHRRHLCVDSICRIFFFFWSSLAANGQYLKRLIVQNTKLTSDKRRQMSVKIVDRLQGNNGSFCIS